MIRFNYLQDAAPDIVDRMRGIRIAPAFVMPLYAAVTALAVVLSVTVLLHVRLAHALAEQSAAQQRFDATKVALSKAKLERTHIETLISLDRRLRAVRDSGLLASRQLAEIANHVPRNAWLSTIDQASDGITIDGEAEGLEGVGNALNGMIATRGIANPRLLRAAAEDRTHGENVLSFELALGDSTK